MDLPAETGKALNTFIFFSREYFLSNQGG